MQVFPVILAGGSGTRLWPLSRQQYPKQYLPLIGENTMLQDTVLRLAELKFLAEPIIICNSLHRFLVAEQMQKIGVSSPTIILEPVGRNTAPAIAAAAFQVQKMTSNEGGLLLVLPADHVIKDILAFHQAIDTAIKFAKNGKLVTFGIPPTSPNTGYGYIKANYSIDTHPAMNVEFFTEKPSHVLAEEYIDENAILISKNLPLNWYWNGGMFVFLTTTLLQELSKYEDEVVKAAKKSVESARLDLDFLRLDKKAFSCSPDISIDYALMEKSDLVVVVPLKAEWCDVGSWAALHDASSKDKDSNVLRGDIFAHETKNCFISSTNQLVSTIGVENLIIVGTPDALLVTTYEQAHKVKDIIKTLSSAGRSEATSNQKMHRPWGWYDSIEVGENYQVKRLHVNPGAKLSLQLHHKRAEHWVVVNGTATAIVGDKVLTLIKGQSTYIPATEKHSLENRTNEPLDVIEVQSGSYVGEDDIVRFKDVYGRIE